MSELATQVEPLVAVLQEQLRADFVSLVLYGSRARGDHHSASDWDLLLIANQLPASVFQRHLFIRGLLPQWWRGRASILAKTPLEFEATVPPLFLDIALDGIILYDCDRYMHKHLTYLRSQINSQGLYREQIGRDFFWQWHEFPGMGHQISWGI